MVLVVSSEREGLKSVRKSEKDVVPMLSVCRELRDCRKRKKKKMLHSTGCVIDAVLPSAVGKVSKKKKKKY